jgi:hypothetical protein
METTRLFHIKLKLLLKCIRKDYILGKCLAMTYTIQFQKRGLPYAHIIVWIDPTDCISTIDDVDRCVGASLPTTDDPVLLELVLRHMIHSKCHQGRPCWSFSAGSCRFGFPKSFVDCTTISDDTG